MEDPRSLLGVGPDATDAEVRRARRRLARALHPDLHDARSRADAAKRMAIVNRAYDIVHAEATGAARPASVPPTPARPVARSPDGASRWPSATGDDAFAIEALPVDAFEATLLAAVNLGDVVRAEDPYLLAVLLDDPGPCECILELAPDAGATTVSIEIGPRHFGTCPGVRAVRDAFVAEIRRQEEAG